MQLEKEIMMLLNHPFIARCGSAFQDATRLHLIVELGDTLNPRILREKLPPLCEGCFPV